LRTEIVNLGTGSTTERSVGLLDSLDNIYLFLSKVFFDAKKIDKKTLLSQHWQNMIERLLGFGFTLSINDKLVKTLILDG